MALHCGARGNPPPSIIWTKKNRDLAGLDHSVRNKDIGQETFIREETIKLPDNFVLFVCVVEKYHDEVDN